MGGLIIFLIVLLIITIGGTLLVGLQESKTLKKHKEEDTAESQLERSLNYESSSLKSNLPILGIIYLVTFLAATAGIIIYFFF
ncbi:hypothetical protein [Aquibacillus saliphilus]|uniref:hypothetical protein n=1 Tax=Aquibacillus saliphilus TaxID=1909422 RepID=UPI001CEFB2C4|nr:hypothetical protein [Aquibacillus saliphilus]